EHRPGAALRAAGPHSRRAPCDRPRAPRRFLRSQRLARHLLGHHRFHGRDHRGDAGLEDQVQAHLALAVVLGRDGADSRQHHHLAARRNLHQDQADHLLCDGRGPASVRHVYRTKLAEAGARQRLSGTLGSWLEDPHPQLGTVLHRHGAGERSGVADDQHRFLGRLQTVGRPSRHLPVRARQRAHADAPRHAAGNQGRNSDAAKPM
ncbi:MAG: Intracellular septation protein IspA, partial [uncultured Sphingosinicella sp.]